MAPMGYQESKPGTVLTKHGTAEVMRQNALKNRI